MKKLVNRLAFGLWIVGAPFVVLGCAEDASKPADTAAPAATPGPADAAKPAATPGPADAAKPADDAAKK